ncbi:MAG: glycosyltransferase [Chloroflexi bacterium]|nr:glycosyltransferase [Chloroflexota bacterium]
MFRALQRLIEEKHEIVDDLRLRLVGSFSRDELGQINELGIASLVDVTGTIDHAESLQLQVDAAVLLLVTVTGKSSISTTKLWEYLAARRPILALAGDCPARDTVERFQAGIVVAPDDVEGIKNALLKLYTRWKQDDLVVNHNGHTEFEFGNLTQRLARVLDQCTENRTV